MKRLHAMLLALTLLIALLPGRAEAPVGLDRLMEEIETLPEGEALTPPPEEVRKLSWKELKLSALYQRFNSEHYYFARTITTSNSLICTLASGVALALQRELGFNVRSNTDYYIDVGTPSDYVLEQCGTAAEGWAYPNCAMVTLVDLRTQRVYWVFWDQSSEYAHYVKSDCNQTQYEWPDAVATFYHSFYDLNAYWPGHTHLRYTELASAMSSVAAVEEALGFTSASTPTPKVTATPGPLRAMTLLALPVFVEQKAQEHGLLMNVYDDVSNLADYMMTQYVRYTVAGVGMHGWGRSIESTDYRVLIGKPAPDVLSLYKGCSEYNDLRGNGALLLVHIRRNTVTLYFWKVTSKTCYVAATSFTESDLSRLGITYFFTAFYYGDASFIRYSDMEEEVAWIRQMTGQLLTTPTPTATPTATPTPTPVSRPTATGPVGRVTPSTSGSPVRPTPSREFGLGEISFEISPDRQSIFIDRPAVTGSSDYTLAYNIYDSASRPVNYFYSTEARVAATPGYGGVFNVFVVATDKATNQSITKNIGWHTLNWPYADHLTVGKAASAFSPDMKSVYIDRPSVACRGGQVTIAYNLYDANGVPFNYFYSTEPRVAVTPGTPGRYNVFIVVTDTATGETNTQNIGWQDMK